MLPISYEEVYGSFRGFGRSRIRVLPVFRATSKGLSGFRKLSVPCMVVFLILGSVYQTRVYAEVTLDTAVQLADAIAKSVISSSASVAETHDGFLYPAAGYPENLRRECVALTRALNNQIGPTRDWERGPDILPDETGMYPLIVPGTPVATFEPGPDGQYPGKGFLSNGQVAHAGVFLSYVWDDANVLVGMYLLDQYSFGGGKPAGPTLFMFKNADRHYKDGRNYSVIKGKEISNVPSVGGEHATAAARGGTDWRDDLGNAVLLHPGESHGGVAFGSHGEISVGSTRLFQGRLLGITNFDYFYLRVYETGEGAQIVELFQVAEDLSINADDPLLGTVLVPADGDMLHETSFPDH